MCSDEEAGDGWWESGVAVPLGSTGSFPKWGHNSWMHVHSTLQSGDSLCLLTARLSQIQAGALAHTDTSTLQKIPNEAVKTQITGGPARAPWEDANGRGVRLTAML